MKKIILITAVVIITAISAYIIYRAYPSVNPLGSVKLKFNSIEIAEKGRALIKSLHLDDEDKTETTVLNTDNSLRKYIYDSYTFREANELIRNKIPVYKWELEWKNPEENIVLGDNDNVREVISAGDIILNYDLDGNLLRYKTEVGDSTELEGIPENQARMLAKDFLKKYTPVGIENSTTSFRYNTVNSFREKDPKKYKKQSEKEYTFVWQAKSADINRDLIASVTVSGRVISEYKLSFDVPGVTEKEQNSIFSVATSVPFYIIVYILIIIIGYKRIRAYEVSFRLAVIMGLIVGVTFSLNLYTIIADSSTGWELWIPLIASTLFLAAGVFISWAVSETIAREAWKQKFISIDLISKGYALHSKVGKAGLYGLAGGFLIYLIWTALLFLSEQVLNISIISKNGSSLVSHFYALSPVLNVINKSIYPQIYAVAIFLLFVHSGLKRRFNSPYILIMLSAAIWGLVNFNDLHPLYWGVITGIITGGLFIILFYYYDVLTALTALIVFNIIDIGVSLFTSGNSYYVNAGYYLVLVFILFIVFLSFGILTKDKITDFDSITPAFVKNITERQRMQRELEIARDVQMSFLPVKDPLFQNLDIAGKCIPANEVGGDYYDYVVLDKNRLGIIIGDVSGKGTQAAFYMTLAKGFVKALSKTVDSPSEFLIKINELFFENVERGTFISMIYGIFDVDARTLTFSRAGHNPVIAKHSGKKEIELLNPVGLALGLEKGKIFNSTIKEIKVDLHPGDTFVFYTDGFTEAMNKYKLEFTEERLTETILKSIDLSANDILEKTIGDVKTFIGKAMQHDDMTMVVVKYNT